MYVPTDPTRQSPKAAEYQFLKLWVHNELTEVRHHHNAGWASIKRSNQIFSEQGFKCERPDGEVYFLFPPSVVVEEGDEIDWGAASGRVDKWTVTATNRVREFVRCEVRRPRSGEGPIEDLLRSTGLAEAAEYLSNAKQRLVEGTPTAWGDCISNCRNALQSAIRQLTGEGQISAGIKKLRDVCDFGDRESDFVAALEKLLVASRDVLSKSGAHPPLPGYDFAIFAYDLTMVVLRFIVNSR
jgi:hypothetical protein